MKIFFCDNRLGGLLGFRIDIIRYFAEQGHDVCLIAPPAVTDWDKVGAQLPNGVRIKHIKMQPSGINPLSDISLFFQYLKIFHDERPDIVFNYTIKPNIYSAIAAKRCGSRVFSMLAGLGYMFEGKGLLKSLGLRLYKYGLSKAEKIMVLNQMNYDKMIATKMVDRNKLLHLTGGEGVNLNEYQHKPTNYPNHTTFLMVSRMLKDKGYTEFIEAAKKLKGQCQNVSFEILGPTAYDSPMGVNQVTFENDQKANLFHYLGVVQNINSVVGREDVVVVLPSKYGEGLNRSLMEACAIGRPIITTDIPGCKETVDEGRNGFLVPMGDAEALAEAMKRFLALSENDKEKMASESRKLANEKFDVNKVIKVYEQFISQV